MALVKKMILARTTPEAQEETGVYIRDLEGIELERAEEEENDRRFTL